MSIIFMNQLLKKEKNTTCALKYVNTFEQCHEKSYTRGGYKRWETKLVPGLAESFHLKRAGTVSNLLHCLKLPHWAAKMNGLHEKWSFIARLSLKRGGLNQG